MSELGTKLGKLRALRGSLQPRCKTAEEFNANLDALTSALGSLRIDVQAPDPVAIEEAIGEQDADTGPAELGESEGEAPARKSKRGRNRQNKSGRDRGE